jgi:DNA-directed RNA polymerase specialized sigma24 family protein
LTIPRGWRSTFECTMNRIREIQDEQSPLQPVPDPPGAAGGHGHIMQDLLAGLPPKERASLIRYYVRGQDEQRICRELGMPAAEFRALRARVTGTRAGVERVSELLMSWNLR